MASTRMTRRKILLSSAAAMVAPRGSAQGNMQRPNVLMIPIDDLNDWIGVLGGHPQTITPNLDRLARSGIVFSNAH